MIAEQKEKEIRGTQDNLTSQNKTVSRAIDAKTKNKNDFDHYKRQRDRAAEEREALRRNELVGQEKGREL
jgi:hypothetical protein